MNKWFKVSTIARDCDLGKATIYKAIYAGELEAERFGKKSVRVSEEALARWRSVLKVGEPT